MASFDLKPEQDQAVQELLMGKDVLAVLPTGFGKSVIFQSFATLKTVERNGCVVVLVISPLTSIIEDQMTKSNSLGLKAVDLSALSDEGLKECDFTLLFSSAEEALNPRFVNELKDNNSRLHKWLACIVVDESHTVETWTGKRARRLRKKDKRGTEGFRSAYGKLSQLRSLCEESVPLLALTGTSDSITQKTICEVLLLVSPTKIFISPNRENLRFCIKKGTKKDINSHLNWIVRLLREQGSNMAKTIIFCNTLNDIAIVFSELVYKLGESAYAPRSSRDKKDLLIGIFHSLSWKENKANIFQSLKEDGKKRLIIASTALSMGVDFPDIRYIVNWGPARTLLDQHQEAGRAGRDGKQSHVVILYHGQQLSHCDDDVKEFIKSEGCYRVAGYKPFDRNITPLTPGHLCCSNCARSCTCDKDDCKLPLPFEATSCESACKESDVDEQELHTRSVSDEDRKDIKETLMEVKESIPSGCNAFGAFTAHGFTDELINSVLDNCHKLFTVKDVMEHLPIFSVQHTVKILEILQEIFNDIPNLDSALPLLGHHEYDNNDECHELLFHDTDSDSASSFDGELDDLQDYYMYVCYLSYYTLTVWMPYARATCRKLANQITLKKLNPDRTDIGISQSV